jgi:hypothetical protein
MSAQVRAAEAAPDQASAADAAPSWIARRNINFLL